MQKQAHVVVISGGSIDTSILYPITLFDCANMTGKECVFFNSRIVSCETSGGYVHRSDRLLAPALSYNARAKKIDNLDIELLKQMLSAKRSRWPLLDPACTIIRY